MKKYILPLLLIFALLLSGCGSKQETTEQSCSTILKVMLAAAPEGQEEIEHINTAGDIDGYLADVYGLPDLHWYDGAIARLGGARAFELAVIKLNDDDDIDMVTEQLQEYLLSRQGDFIGYAPDQAALVENALILTKSQCVALIISEDPDTVRAAFESCFGSGANAVGVPEVLQTETLPNGRVPYTDPEIDDMTLYDTSAILAAWDSGDRSALSDKDAAILSAAEAVLDEVTTGNMSDYEKEWAVYSWLTGAVGYDWDHYDPTVTTDPDSYDPYGPLMNGKGVCLGYATVFQLLMDMADVECITVVGAAFSSREDHAWNMVRLNGQWYCVDATWDIWSGGYLEYCNYFNVTSDYMAETDHQWDYDSVPEATADDGGRP